MIKKDRIFYSACGIFLIGVILGIMGYELSILFIVGAYLLRPTLHAFDLAEKYADERQRQIHSRAGNMAFIAVMIAAVVFALLRIAHGEYADEMYMIILIGIGARALVGLFMIGELRRTGVIITISIGVIFSMFALASAGFNTMGLSMAIIGLAFASLGLLARKYPRVVSLIIISITLLLIIALRLYDFNHPNITMLVVSLIMIIASLFLIMSSISNSELSITKLSKSIRKIVLVIVTAIVFVFLISIQAKIISSKETNILSNTEVQGVSSVGPFAYYANGKLQSCTLAREDTLSGQPLPAGTVVHFTSEGIFDWCFLPENINIQGHLCRGKGHQFMTSFYPNGQLKTAWLANDEKIDGIPCQKCNFFASFKKGGGGTYFYENGKLKGCYLSEDFIIDGKKFKRGDYITFDEEGYLITDSE